MEKAVETKVLMKDARPAGPVYQIKITLRDIRPPVWRRILVPGDIGLGDLHEVIQKTMGWMNCHMHSFSAGGRYYGVPDPELDDMEDEEDVRLHDVAPQPGSTLAYEYDFGDGWEHTIRVEKIKPSFEGFRGFPVCLKGARSCPPEDSGGAGGYGEFLAAIGNPKHPDHADMREWIGGRFDPEAFDPGQVNKGLRELRLSVRKAP